MASHGTFRRRGGFTLVELLVVIGIIALLLSILMPALAKAKEYSLRTKCASNLRSLGQAILMFANQNGGRVPLAINQQGGIGGQYSKEVNTMNSHDFFGLLDSCGAMKQLFRCPATKPPTYEIGNQTGQYVVIVNGAVAASETDARNLSSNFYTTDDPTKWPLWNDGGYITIGYTYMGASHLPYSTNARTLNLGYQAPYEVYKTGESMPKWGDQLLVTKQYFGGAAASDDCQRQADDLRNPPIASDITWIWSDTSGPKDTTYSGNINHGDPGNYFCNTLRLDGSVTGVYNQSTWWLRKNWSSQAAGSYSIWYYR